MRMMRTLQCLVWNSPGHRLHDHHLPTHIHGHTRSRHIWYINCYPDYKEQEVAHTFCFVYQILTLLAHLFSIAIQTGMILTVLEVRAIWFHTDMDDRTDDLADSILSEVEKPAVSRYYEC